MVTWQGEKILLSTVNHHPERYIEGESIALPGEVWVVTDTDLLARCAERQVDVTDWSLRLKQLVGVPPDGE